MRCPFCLHDNDKVVDSRSADDGHAIRRRRQCVNCSKRFTTYEHVETRARLTVIKKDSTREPFERQNIIDGLQKACYKRQISAETLVAICDDVEEELYTRHDREVPTEVMGHSVSDRLRQVDHVAYVRFASVYKQFRDLDDFLNEVRDVLESDTNSKDQGRLFRE